MRAPGLITVCLLRGSLMLAAVPSVAAETAADAPRAVETDDGRIMTDGPIFDSWHDYANSEYFVQQGLRCGTRPSGAEAGVRGGSASDCTMNFTDPDPVYDPGVVKYRIPVVVHVIRNSSGSTGNISQAMVQSQIDILNEDFLALPGTNGANGTDVQIEFYLATEDPDGSPTTGITYSNNTTWYNDGGGYWNTLAWDTNRYLNIYTNSASGYLGYVPDLPQGGGLVGATADRVVILWSSFGRNAPIGPPYNQGRTTTHEVGHYLGLWHTFDNGCGTVPGCASTGDRICDTNRESQPHYGCSSSSTCSSSDPIHNYMNYTDDLCMTEFTPDQSRRERCTLEHWRPDLYEVVVVETCADGILNQDEQRIDCGGTCAPCECLSDGDCDDELWCTGTDSCDAFGQCQTTGDPCSGGEWCDESAGCVAYGDGDFDLDLDVDLDDSRVFQQCFGLTATGACAPGNFSGSGVIDLADFGGFATELAASGPQ